MAKRVWSVEAGSDDEHQTTHAYEKPKDAVRVARRYMRRSVNQQGLEGSVQNLKIKKNARVLVHDDTSDYASVQELKIRPKNFGVEPISDHRHPTQHNLSPVKGDNNG